MKNLLIVFILLLTVQGASAQYNPQKFGKGINIVGKDSTFTMRFGVRFQTLMSANWDVRNDDFGFVEGLESNFLIRRSRFKFDGYAFTPKLKYKMEFGLTNRDIGGGIDAEHNKAPRFILDAFVDWNFYGNFSLKAGQAKLPGNRERVISSANLQMVDRSRLNSRYNIDRDIGVQLKHHFKIGNNFIVKEVASLSQGEGRNLTVNNIGGYDYTFRIEMLPFGKFQSKGDYVGAAIKREDKPKLALGFTYDINDRAARERGQGGSFIYNDDGSYGNAKTLNTVFADLMFKYKGLSIMAEYANKTTDDGTADVYDNVDTSLVVGTYYVGSGLNVQAGWMFKKNVELSGRYTMITPNVGVSNNETEYTLGLSKYFVGHKLKVQTDLSYRQNGFANSTAVNSGKDDILFWRLQMDIHF
ncbi:MAG: phosphate-selective porin OprO/OprP [Crocinitomix sp.]|jgi:phosphate-selective porin OprO/OprP